MNKVTITTKRLIQQLYPFLGKIVFTLKGDNSELVTSFIPEVSIFCNSIAISHLVPNALIEDAITYYHYAIYPQGHVPGIFLSEPVEEGDCIVPDHDCELDDIISPVPDKNTAEKIIADASSMIAEIRAALEQARECSETACTAAQETSSAISTISHLTNKNEEYYTWIKNRQAAIEEATAMLDNYQANIEQQIHNIFIQDTQALQRTIQEEQNIVNALWDRVNQIYLGLENVLDLQAMVRNLHDAYIADMNLLREEVAAFHVPTKLSELENDILEPITNQEINTLYGV